MTSRRHTLMAVCLATFMLLLDITIVNVALPSIGSDLGAGMTQLQWVVDAYAVVLAALLLTSGSLADRLGRQRVFVAGAVVFTLASAACALAPGAGALIAGRALQGIGGAAMLATSLALIGQEFEGPALGRAIAAWGATVGAGVAAGPLAGGLLTQTLGWRAIFLVNVPIGAVAAAVALRRTPNVRSARRGSLDWPGLAVFSASLFVLVLSLLRGNSAGWDSASIRLGLLGAVAGGLVFVRLERRRRAPMLDLRLFRNPAFTGVSIATFAIGCGVFAQMLFLSLYLQATVGLSPLAAGARLLFLTAPVLVVPLVVVRLVPQAPPSVMLARGMALTTAGVAAMAGALGLDGGWLPLVPGLALTGVGVGITNPAIGSTALRVVDRTQSGMASGISNTCRMGGVATGIALLGAVFDHHAGTAGAAAGRGGLELTLAVGAGMALLGTAAAWLLVARPFRRAAAAGGLTAASAAG